LAVEKVYLFLFDALAMMQGPTTKEVDLVVAIKIIQSQIVVEALHLEIEKVKKPFSLTYEHLK